MERARKGPRKSWRARNATEVGQLLILTGVKCRTGCDGFRTDQGRGRDPPGGQDGCRQVRGKLREAESMNAGDGAALECCRSDQIVGRAPGRRNDQRTAVDPRRQPRLRLAQPDGGF